MKTLDFILYFDALAFFAYGLSCLYAPKMRLEFVRFGLSNAQRIITGVAQLLGSLAIILGQFLFPMIGGAAAIGLTILMAAGFGVRRKIKDTWADSLPSLLFLLLNLYVAYIFFSV